MTDITLSRIGALEHIFPNPDEYLFITGLAGPARDAAALTNDGPNMFTMAGCMGAAVSMGLGMALSAPTKKVCVIAGDGEMLMNIGSLATVASQAPENLTIVCVDNGGHGETGGQVGHTALRTDLAKIADGAGIANVMTVSSSDGLMAAADFVKSGVGPRFLWLRVLPGDPTSFKRNMNPMECRMRFKTAYLGG
ncbi:thiamine pyrophosphate-dependent enzyme [Rhodospirillales bacterium]|jgi:phosphonopyruvate decarboxylase|nr:thiamine pyrophosphate-dependent enzyme [Rhodospirillales bacterium]